MITTNQPMTCPKCGETMNRHAIKPKQQEEGDLAEAALIEVHGCPDCGATAARPYEG